MQQRHLGESQRPHGTLLPERCPLDASGFFRACCLQALVSIAFSLEYPCEHNLLLRQLCEGRAHTQAGMELRVLHTVAHRQTWYGGWGYAFGRGGFAIGKQVCALLGTLCCLSINALLQSIDIHSAQTQVVAMESLGLTTGHCAGVEARYGRCGMRLAGRPAGRLCRLRPMPSSHH